MKRFAGGCVFALALGVVASGISQTTQPAPRPIPPPKGDETPFTKVEANPRDYIDEPFLAVVGLQVEDYYHGRYINAQRTHYSLDGHELGEHGTLTGRSIMLYARRGDFDAVVDAVVEATKDSVGSAKLARIKAIIKRERYDPNAGLTAELIDVQFPTQDRTAWGKWELAAPISTQSELDDPESIKVWWRGGADVHYHRLGCAIIKRAKAPKELTLAEAVAKKLTPCSKCAPPAPREPKPQPKSDPPKSATPAPTDRR